MHCLDWLGDIPSVPTTNGGFVKYVVNKSLFFVNKVYKKALGVCIFLNKAVNTKSANGGLIQSIVVRLHFFNHTSKQKSRGDFCRHKGNFGRSLNQFLNNIFVLQSCSITYDHRSQNIGHPVRSGILKLRTGRLVVRWVTTSEYRLLYVLPFCSVYP